MAVHNPASRDAESGDEGATDASPGTSESAGLGVGMAHPTVVPTNFEPDEANRQD